MKPEILKAREAGTKAALEGKHIDANTYAETDDLHWEWLQGWVNVRLDRIKRRKHNVNMLAPADFARNLS